MPEWKDGRLNPLTAIFKGLLLESTRGSCSFIKTYRFRSPGSFWIAALLLFLGVQAYLGKLLATSCRDLLHAFLVWLANCLLMVNFSSWQDAQSFVLCLQSELFAALMFWLRSRSIAKWTCVKLFVGVWRCILCKWEDVWEHIFQF